MAPVKTCGQRVTAREFLKTARGASWLQCFNKTRAHTNGIGPISDVIGIIDFIGGLVGSGKPPGLTPEDLQQYHESIFDEIKNVGDGLSQQIGDLGDYLGGVPGQLDELKKIAEDARKAQEAGDEKLYNDLMNQMATILDNQQKNTEKILDSIGDLSNHVSGMWQDMNTWFGEAMVQLNEMEAMLSNISDQLKEINGKLDELLEGINEVKDRVDWGAMASIVTEHQTRIRYAIESALNIHVTPMEAISEDSESPPPTLVVDKTELQEWARKTCDLATGLSYHLFGLHQALIGKTLIRKPLMEVYFRIFSHGDLPTNIKIPRLFGEFVALQAQGFGVLEKARQYLGFPALDFNKTLVERVEQQLQKTAPYVSSVLGLTEWRDVLDESRIQKSPPPLKEFAEESQQWEYYLMVPGSNQIASSLCPWSGVEDSGVTLRYGQVNPSTRELEDIQSTEILHDGTKLSYLKAFNTVYMPYNESSGYSVDPRGIVVDPKYVIVGFRFTSSYVSGYGSHTRLEPIVSLWDPVSCTTTWNGRDGEIFLASLPNQEYEHGLTGEGEHGVPYMLSEINGTEHHGILRGARLSTLLTAESLAMFCIGYVSTGWTADTWLPMQTEPTAGVSYTPISVPWKPEES